MFLKNEPHWLLLIPLLLAAIDCMDVFQKRPWVKLMTVVVLTLFCICLLALSGCGTAPLPAKTSPPMPVALLTPTTPACAVAPVQCVSYLTARNLN